MCLSILCEHIRFRRIQTVAIVPKGLIYAHDMPTSELLEKKPLFFRRLQHYILIDILPVSVRQTTISCTEYHAKLIGNNWFPLIGTKVHIDTLGSLNRLRGRNQLRFSLRKPY